jgi:hypothetical protein
VTKNGRKVKAITLLTAHFFATYFIFDKVAKNGRKVKVIALLFALFSHLFHFSKSGKKWTKS